MIFTKKIWQINIVILTLLTPKMCLAEVGFTLALNTDRFAHQAQAVDVLEYDFFNPNEGGAPPTSTTGGIGNGGLNHPRFNIQRQQNSHEVQFLMRSRTVVSKQMKFTVSAGIARGTSRYVLPDGIAPFTEAMDLRIDYSTVSLEATLDQDYSWVTVFVGLGAQKTWSKSRLTSALLDVQSKDSFYAPYLVSGMRYDLPNTSLAVTGRLYVYSSENIDAQIGIGINF
mgnify:CR=1 FL=1